MKQSIRATVALAIATTWTGAHAAGEVTLQQVTSTVSSRYGMSQQGTTFEANVANIAFNKQVFAHYRGPDGAWVDVPLTFKRRLGEGREIWSGGLGLPLNTTHDVQFALKYVVNGQTYWDNNRGANYFVPKDSGASLGAGVKVYDLYHQATARLGTTDTHVHGTVVLKNLAVAKAVDVVYSTDRWASSGTVAATYSPSHWAGAYSTAANPNGTGHEVWVYSLPVDTSATQVEYAIRYRVNGETFWDNNGGLNYRTSIERQGR